MYSRRAVHISSSSSGAAPATLRATSISIRFNWRRAPHPTGFAPRRLVEIGTEPDTPAGIYATGRARSLSCFAHNYGTTPVEVRVQISATDFEDRPVAMPEIKLTLPADTGVRHPVRIPLDWRGHYRLTARYILPDTTETQTLRIAIVPPRADNERDSILGINHAFADPYLIDLAKLAGVSCIAPGPSAGSPSSPRKTSATGPKPTARSLASSTPTLTSSPSFRLPLHQLEHRSPRRHHHHRLPRLANPRSLRPQRPRQARRFLRRRRLPLQRPHSRLGIPQRADLHRLRPAWRQCPQPQRQTLRPRRLRRAAQGHVRPLPPGRSRLQGPRRPRRPAGQEHVRCDCRRLPQACRHLQSPRIPLRPPRSRRPPQWTTCSSSWTSTAAANPSGSPNSPNYGLDDLPRQPFNPLPHNWAKSACLDSEKQCAQYTVRYMALMCSRGVEKMFIHSGASALSTNPTPNAASSATAASPPKTFPALAVLTHLLGPNPKFVGEKKLAPPRSSSPSKRAPRPSSSPGTPTIPA